MSNLNDFTGIIADGPSVQDLGQVSGNIQLDLSQYTTFVVEPTASTTFTLTGLGTSDIRRSAHVIIFYGGSSDFTWDSRVIFSADFDGFFTQTSSNQEVDIVDLLQLSDTEVLAKVIHTETTGT